MEKVIVIGGGIIGLLLSRAFAQEGLSVTLLDRQQLGSEASWAGGGILAPMYPWRYPEALNQLVDWQSANFTQLSEALLAETGIDSEVSLCGLNMIDVEDEDEASVWAQTVLGIKSGLNKVSAQAFTEREPLLAGRCGLSNYSVLNLPLVGNVRNPRLLRALKESLSLDERVQVKTHCIVESFVKKGEKIVGVSTNQGILHADECIVAAGAWSGKLLNTLQVKLPVEPVKGQMLVVKAKPGQVNSVILSKACYLIPRLDGRVLVGSTVEYSGFDKAPSAAARKTLLDAAYALVPELKTAVVEKHWAGLRPSSPMGVPYIARVPEVEGLSVCTGHFRNGVVTAPYSVQLMVELLMARDTCVDPAPYSLLREPDEVVSV